MVSSLCITIIICPFHGTFANCNTLASIFFPPPATTTSKPNGLVGTKGSGSAGLPTSVNSNSSNSEGNGGSNVSSNHPVTVLPKDQRNSITPESLTRPRNSFSPIQRPAVDGIKKGAQSIDENLEKVTDISLQADSVAINHSQDNAQQYEETPEKKDSQSQMRKSKAQSHNSNLQRSRKRENSYSNSNYGSSTPPAPIQNSDPSSNQNQNQNRNRNLNSETYNVNLNGNQQKAPPKGAGNGTNNNNSKNSVKYANQKSNRNQGGHSKKI